MVKLMLHHTGQIAFYPLVMMLELLIIPLHTDTLDNKYYALTYGGLANIYTVSEKQYGINVYSLDYGSTKLYRQIDGQKKEYLGSEGVWIGSPLSRTSF